MAELKFGIKIYSLQLNILINQILDDDNASTSLSDIREEQVKK